MQRETVTPVTYVGFRVTEQCNAGTACAERCFSQEGVVVPDAPLFTVNTISRRIKEGGGRALNIMGGEPTIRDDLQDIIRYVHDDLGLQVVLSTNALQLTPQRLDKLHPHLTWLSLSLDADNKELNDAFRGSGQWDAAMGVGEWFQKKPRSVGWKVNTQVNAVNLDHIARIPEEIGSKSIDVWKLLQWTPRGNAAYVEDRYAITPEQFKSVAQEMRDRYPNLRIIERPYPETHPDTGIVRPDGTYEINAGDHTYQVIGNILTEDPEQLFQKAAIIYKQFPNTNNTEFLESYPPLWKEV